MTLKIALSQIANANDFAAEVAAHIKAKKVHQKTTDGEPAPTASSMVESAVRVVRYPIDEQRADDYVADYEIITPPPLTLDESKTKLAVEAQETYDAALEILFPKLKRRLFQIRADAARTTKPEKRTPADNAMVAAAAAIEAKAVALHTQLAEAEDAISDLTEETIAAYKVPAFGA